MSPSRNIGASTMPNRAASLLCMVGVCCITWELGRQMGGSHMARGSLEGGSEAGIRMGRAVAAVPTQQTQPASPAASTSWAVEKDANRTASERLPVSARNVPISGREIGVSKADLPTDGPRIPIQDTAVDAEGTDKLHPDRFWRAYAADRYSLLTRGVVAGNGDLRGNDAFSPAQAEGSLRVQPTKYLVFVNTVHGLGNHMAGMMSAFVLSIVTERVFLHDWVEPRGQVAARYDELFVPPFEPWDTSAAPGSLISGPDGLLPAAAKVQPSKSVGQSWVKIPEISSEKESKRCRLEFTPSGGVTKGHFNDVFLRKRGQEPRPDCPVLFVFTNQFLVEIMASPAYGSSEVGGVHISEWLRAGRASNTLFHGLFRAVAPVRQRVEDEALRLFPNDGQTMAAHARSFFLGSIPRNNKFVGCLQQLALSKNISTVLLASDMNDFDKLVASKLKPHGINVVMMKGVQRSGEGAKMRNTLGKIQLALTEMMLVGKADIVVTSPRSSFSALAAASGGESTERFGGISCKSLLNEPEFHSLECAKHEWHVEQVGNPKQWDEVYHVVGSNSARCKG